MLSLVRCVRKKRPLRFYTWVVEPPASPISMLSRCFENTTALTYTRRFFRTSKPLTLRHENSTLNSGGGGAIDRSTNATRHLFRTYRYSAQASSMVVRRGFAKPKSHGRRGAGCATCHNLLAGRAARASETAARSSGRAV